MFQLKIKEDGDQWVNVTVSGALNEDAKKTLVRHQDGLAAKSCRFDFAKLSFINSTGVRDWVHFIAKVAADKKLEFHNCPSEVIYNVNAIPGFGRNAKICSVRFGFNCPHCSNTEMRVLHDGMDYRQGGLPKFPPPVCGKCGHTTEADEPIGQFFQFLSTGT